MPSSRRAFLAAQGALLGASLLPGRLLAAVEAKTPAMPTLDDWKQVRDQFHLTRGYLHFAGFYIADSKGYYTQEGVKPQFLAGGPNLQGVEPIVAGGSAIVTRVTDTGEAGFDVYVEQSRLSALKEVLASAGVADLDPETADILRVEAGVKRQQPRIIPE